MYCAFYCRRGCGDRKKHNTDPAVKRDLFVPLSFCLRDLTSARRGYLAPSAPTAARGLLQSAIPLQSFCLIMLFLRRCLPGTLSSKVPLAYMKLSGSIIPHRYILCKRFLTFPRFSAKSSPVHVGQSCLFSNYSQYLHNFSLYSAATRGGAFLKDPSGSPRRPRNARSSPCIFPASRLSPAGRP